jgi:DNA-binding NarL/FixJ family response regulator
MARVRQTLGEVFEVVGAVEDGKQAVNGVLTLNPDALVIDISMPVLNGLQAAKHLQTANCRAKIIFLTIHESRDFLDAAFSLGLPATSTRLASPPTSSQQFTRRCWDESLYPRRYRCSVTALHPREGVRPESFR